MSQTCSDTTLGNLPAAMLSGDTTADGDSVLVDASQDMFDTTLTGPMTSTQADAPTTDTDPEPEQTAHLYTKTERLCVEGCNFRTSMTRKTKKIGPVQCHLCQHWIHPPCVGEKDEDIVNIWTFPTCRMMPDKLTTIIDTLAAMREENIMLKTRITTEVSDIHNTIKDHCQKCESKDIQTQKLSESLQEKIREHTQAMNEITNLRCKVSELNTKLSAQSWSSFRGYSSPRTVLLGSSIVRDISKSRLLNTDVTSISGGHFNDISNALDKKPSDEKYDRAIRVVGGNDCDPRDATNTSSASTIVDNYRRPVKQTKTKVKTVTVSSVCDNIMMKCIHYDVNIVMLGDFNVNMLKSNDFTDCLDVNGLKNIVDLIVTNEPKRFKRSVCVDTGLSDFHSLVCTATKLQIPKLKLNKFKYRSYKTFDSESFMHDLPVIPFHVTEVFDDVDDSYWAWNELTMQVVNEHAPIKTKTIKGHRVPYMNGELGICLNVNMTNVKPLLIGLNIDIKEI